MTFSFDIKSINNDNIKSINDANLTAVLTTMNDSFNEFNNNTKLINGTICGVKININNPEDDIERIKSLLNPYVDVLQHIKNLPTVKTGNPNKIVKTTINLGESPVELVSTHQTTFVDYLIMVLNRNRDTLKEMRRNLQTKIATLNSKQPQEEKQQIIKEIIEEYANLDNPNINLNRNIILNKPNEGIISLLSKKSIIANIPVTHFNVSTFSTIKQLLTYFVYIIQKFIRERNSSEVVDRVYKLVSGGGSTKKYRKNKKRKSKKRSSARILRRRQRGQT